MIFARRPRGEKLLGIAYPDRVTEAGFHRVRPSNELSLYTAYIKLTGPEPELMNIVHALRLQRADEDAGLRYLPARWGGPASVRLDWWDATPDTPPTAYASAFGIDGHIVAKMERDALYIVATDTGRTRA